MLNSDENTRNLARSLASILGQVLEYGGGRMRIPRSAVWERPLLNAMLFAERGRKVAARISDRGVSTRGLL